MTIKKNNDNLIWIDLEFSGLDFKTNTILEIATIVTDKNLNILAIGPNIAIKTSKKILDNMDKWNKKHHKDSGLIEKCLNSNISLEEAEQKTLNFLKKYVDEFTSPLCGNSIGQDRRMLYKNMSTLEKFFHYRVIDVSTLKELAKRWAPNLEPFKKKETHTALSDIKESIEELKYLRKNFIKY